MQHRSQNGIGPVGGQALEACIPGLLVQVLEVVVRVVRRHIHRLGNGSIHKGLYRLHHCNMVGGRHVQSGHKVVRQFVHITTQLVVQAPGVVFHRVFGVAPIPLALLALVHPGERWLDSVGCVVGKSQAHGAGRRDGQQVAVANAVFADGLLQGSRQAAGKGAGLQITIGIKLGEGALLLRQRHGGCVGGITHAGGNAGRHLAALGLVVPQAQHGQGVAHAGKTHADTALGRRFIALLLQRPEGYVQHIVQSPHLDGHGLLKGFKVKRWYAGKTERVAHKTRQDDGAQVTAAVRRQRLFTTGVGRSDGLAVAQVVVGVDVVQEQNAGLGKVVGGAHHGVPEFTRFERLVDPLAVGALEGALV